jgi:hypothetical protein
MTVYTFDEAIVSDLHKDARGYRPRSTWWEIWSAAPDAEKQEIWDSLLNELEWESAREREEAERAVKNFESRIELLISTGARDRDTAIRWLVESLELSEIDKMYGGSYVCYHLGLPYSMEHVFDAMLKV